MEHEPFRPLRTGDSRTDEAHAKTYIARLILRMEDCLSRLGVDVTADSCLRRMESMSILIHESMSISSRNYHSVQHVFDISKDLEDPIAILAALFHDCVYYNIDGGLSTVQQTKLHRTLLIEQQETGPDVLHIHPESNTDHLLRMVLTIYGFQPGQVVTPMTGLNEYLSAIIAVRELEPLLSLPVLAQIACCIEATIPFRPVVDGVTPAERLFERFMETSNQFDLQLTEEECVVAVQRACILTNQDVGNFGSEDQLWFLDNTWSLLPESNEALRQQFLYTVTEFQFAVFKMNGFFNFLKPNVIFHQFRGVPSNAEIDRLTRNACRNLEVGRKYVGAKLLSLSVLAAFAELTGGDAPISLFMGDLPSRHHVSSQLEDTLPRPEKASEHCDDLVYKILAHGRRSETSFDVKQSPLAAYFYSCLGDQGLENILKNICLYPMDKEKAETLLTLLPRDALLHVSQNMAKLAMPRRELIKTVIDKLPDEIRKRPREQSSRLVV